VVVVGYRLAEGVRQRGGLLIGRCLGLRSDREHAATPQVFSSRPRSIAAPDVFVNVRDCEIDRLEREILIRCLNTPFEVPMLYAIDAPVYIDSFPSMHSQEKDVLSSEIINFFYFASLIEYGIF